MYMSTAMFKFLDICNYVRPGTSYETWGGQSDNPFAQIPWREDVSKWSWLRRQRTAPKHNFGRDAVRQEGSCALAANARERRKVHRISAERQIDWLRRGGHRGAQRAVGEVRRNAAVVFQQNRLKRGSATAHERLLGTQQARAHARPTKACWRPFCPKHSVVHAAAEVVPWAWFENHSGTWHIDSVPQKIFPWLVNKVTENRRMRDQNSALALLAEVFKLLGNSKLIKALER